MRKEIKRLKQVAEKNVKNLPFGRKLKNIYSYYEDCTQGTVKTKKEREIAQTNAAGIIVS